MKTIRRKITALSEIFRTKHSTSQGYIPLPSTADSLSSELPLLQNVSTIGLRSSPSTVDSASALTSSTQAISTQPNRDASAAPLTALECFRCVTDRSVIVSHDVQVGTQNHCLFVLLVQQMRNCHFRADALPVIPRSRKPSVGA